MRWHLIWVLNKEISEVYAEGTACQRYEGVYTWACRSADMAEWTCMGQVSVGKQDWRVQQAPGNERPCMLMGLHLTWETIEKLLSSFKQGHDMKEEDKTWESRDQSREYYSNLGNSDGACIVSLRWRTDGSESPWHLESTWRGVW